MMDSEIINFAIGKKLEQLNHLVSHYENSYLPELKSATGMSQSEHLKIAKENLNEFKVSVNDYRKSDHSQYLGITGNELLNLVRLYAIEQRELADEWADSNIFIKWRALRRCVFAIKLLVKMKPELEVYSNHWLSSRVKIKLA